MKAFVTGATGNLGRQLVEQLLLKGWAVDAFVLPDEDAGFLAKEGVGIYQGNIRDHISVDRAMGESMPDLVFHLAAYVQLGIISDIETQEDMYNTNVKGTHNVLKAALEHNVRKAVYLSSVAIFGNSERKGPINELSSLGGDYIMEYGKTKYLAYQEAMNIQEQGLALLILLPGIIFGPGCLGTVQYLDYFYKRRMKYLPKDLNDNKIPLAFSRDIFQAIFTGIERNKFGEKYILVESSPTPEEVLRLLSEVTGKEIELKLISYRKALFGIWLREISNRLTRRKSGMNGKIARYLVKNTLQLSYRQEFDTARARRELNWEPSSLIDAIQETVECFHTSNTGLMSERT